MPYVDQTSPPSSFSPRELTATGRLEAFSDGVFAIAITLLILEIRVPNVSSGRLGDALLALWPSYLAFVTSFCTIGMIWVNHHRLFTLIHHADEVLIALNLVLLLLVTWLPFPTALLARNLNQPDQTTAAIIYSGTLLIIAILFNAVLWYARWRDLVAPTAKSHPIVRQYALGPPLYALMLAVGMIDAAACLALSALLAAFFVLPPRLWERRGQSRAPLDAVSPR